MEILKKTQSPQLAAKLVYNQSLETALQRPALKRAIQQVLDNAGLKEIKLAQKLNNIVDTEQDNEVLLRALDMGFKLHGSYAPQEVEIQADFDVWRHLTDEDIKREIVEIAQDIQSN